MYWGTDFREFLSGVLFFIVNALEHVFFYSKYTRGFL